MTLFKIPASHSWVGRLPAGVTVSMIAYEYTGLSHLALLTSGLAVVAVTAFSFNVRAPRVAFVLIGLTLVIWAGLTTMGWLAATETAVQCGAMVMALFTALSVIRSAAMTSPAIVECGRFLARQRLGLRFSALTIGGHLFGLILLYGSVSLLGTLVTESTAREPDREVRLQRTRRMMIDI